MKRFIQNILVLILVLIPYMGMAQSNLQNFLDKMKSSPNPESYVPQIKQEISPYLKGPGTRRTLKEAFQYFTEKNGKVATCIGYLLCQTSKKPQELYDIIKQIPAHNKFYYYNENYSDDRDVYGGCLKNVILFSDGRAAILDMSEIDVDNYDNLASLTSRMPEFIADFYNESKPVFLYNPSGKCMFGYLKEKGSKINMRMCPEESVYERPADDNRLHQFKDNLQYDLVAGVNLDFTNESFKPTYYGFNTADEAIAAKGQMKEEAAKQYVAALTKLLNAQKAALTKKYGVKAFNAIKQCKIYVGMPAGILTEYKEIQEDGTSVQLFDFKGTFRDKAGFYNLYEPSGIFQLFKELGVSLDYNKIFVKNKKVVGWR